MLRAVGFQAVAGDKNLLRLPPLPLVADAAEEERGRLEYALLAVCVCLPACLPACLPLRARVCVCAAQASEVTWWPVMAR